MLIALNQKKKKERKKAFMDYEKHISFWNIQINLLEN